MSWNARIAELRLDADPAAWSAAGFTVDDDRLLVGQTLIRFKPGCRADAGAICGWRLEGVAASEFDRLPTTIGGEQASADPAAPRAHLNGIERIDHVVVFSSELERTIASFEAGGIECRRVREVPIADDRLRQAFFRIGESIVEVVQVPAEKAGPEGLARFWGLAFVVADIDRAAEVMGESLGRVKDAVQSGRRIGTVRKEAGLGVSVALMTPAPKRAAAE